MAWIQTISEAEAEGDLKRQYQVVFIVQVKVDLAHAVGVHRCSDVSIADPTLESIDRTIGRDGIKNLKLRCIQRIVWITP